MLIATNGKIAEKEYLKALKGEPWVTRARVSVVFEGGSPLELVRGAHRRGISDDIDEVWVVCDADSYDTIEPAAEAEARGVVLIWSKPCFEVWLILHFDDCASYFEDATKCGARLKQLYVAWDKTRMDFGAFRESVLRAAQRAKVMPQPPDANPSTAMWRVVEALAGSPDAG